MSLNATKHIKDKIERYGTRVIHLRQDTRFECPKLNKTYHMGGDEFNAVDVDCLGTEHLIIPETRLVRISTNRTEEDGIETDRHKYEYTIYVMPDVDVKPRDRFVEVRWGKDDNPKEIHRTHQVQFVENYYGERGQGVAYKACLCDIYPPRDPNVKNEVGREGERKKMMMKIKKDLKVID